MPYMPVSSKEMMRIAFTDDDVTAYPVQIAIVLDAAGEPEDGDYHDATWAGGDATLIIGSGSEVELTEGEYAVWTRITTATERPVRRSGTLTVGTP
jgi:hypothetical protein